MRHHYGVDEKAANIEALASDIRDRVNAFDRGTRKRAPRSKLRSLATAAGYQRVSPTFRTRLAATLRDVGVVAKPGIDSPDVNGDTWLTFTAAEQEGIALRFADEMGLKVFLRHNWHRIEGLRELRFIQAEAPVGEGRKCDILAFDQITGDYVVIELKDDPEDERLPHQLNHYMTLVHRNRAVPDGHGVRGLVITRLPNPEMADYLQSHSEFPVDWWTFEISLTMSAG